MEELALVLGTAPHPSPAAAWPVYLNLRARGKKKITSLSPSPTTNISDERYSLHLYTSPSERSSVFLTRFFIYQCSARIINPSTFFPPSRRSTLLCSTPRRATKKTTATDSAYQDPPLELRKRLTSPHQTTSAPRRPRRRRLYLHLHQIRLTNTLFLTSLASIDEIVQSQQLHAKKSSTAPLRGIPTTRHDTLATRRASASTQSNTVVYHHTSIDFAFLHRAFLSTPSDSPFFFSFASTPYLWESAP